ncbi:MAG: lipid II flippase MurJ, partial [Verrucomicrobiales bacterium]|nr:lipid II flippase MurJ [Verrucomicrobiales bacterium]
MRVMLVAAGDSLMFWRRNASLQPILAGIFTVGLLTLGVKAIAFGKELVVAQIFGTGDVMDALVIAFLLPSFLAAVIGGEIPHALLPIYNKFRAGGERAEADRLAVNTVWMTVGVLVVLALLLVPLAPLILPAMASNFGAEKLELTRSLFVAMLPFTVFNGVSFVFVLLLQAHKKFALAAVSPAVVPLVTLLFLGFGYERWGTEAFVAGLLTGSALQVAILCRGFRACCQRSVWALSRPGKFELTILKKTVPLAAGGMVMYGTTLVDSAMAALLPAGSVAVLGYADRLCMVVLMLVATAVGEVLLPYFSDRVAVRDFPGLRALLFKFAGLIAGAMVPVVV